MKRYLLLISLLLAAGLGWPAAAQTGAADGLPPRPAPFTFVNDQALLLAPADAKKLEGGLRRYADNTGTQVVVVTVPSLGGRTVADYGRALGTAWGVGQRGKNNGLVVLLSAQEHKVTIQPGSGLADRITPAVVSRVIGQMTPGFKQNNYFAGLRIGLNTLMVTANPNSAPPKLQAGAADALAAGTAAAMAPAAAEPVAPAPAPMAANDPIMAAPAPEPASSGPGMGTLLLGALVIGGGLWFLLRLFRNRSANAPANAAPNFLPGRPGGPTGGGQQPGNYGGNNSGGMNAGGMNAGGMGGGMNMGGGIGMGGMLATGAAAAAGAYLGNRMASGGHDSSSPAFAGDGNATHGEAGPGAGAAGAGLAGAAGTGAAGDYFSGRDAGAEAPGPDYFSNDEAAAGSSDYFSDDNSSSSYDDTSSADTGGGGFDGGGDGGGGDDSGSW